MRHVQKLNDKLRLGCHCGRNVEGVPPDKGVKELNCSCGRKYWINYLGEAYCDEC